MVQLSLSLPLSVCLCRSVSLVVEYECEYLQLKTRAAANFVIFHDYSKTLNDTQRIVARQERLIYQLKLPWIK